VLILIAFKDRKGTNHTNDGNESQYELSVPKNISDIRVLHEVEKTY